MATYLLIIFIFAAGGTYDTDMLAMPNMEACQEQLSDVAKVITPTEGVSYILACLHARDTAEQPI